MSDANTIWIQLYTPNGAKLGVTIGFADGKLTQTLPPVAMIDAMIANAGYLITLPGLEVGEELETITHVIRRTQHNKKNGTQTPCIGLYYESPNLVYAKKAYLNTPEDIATFERLSGLKVTDLPNFPGQLPKRDDPDAKDFIRAAKTPFKIRLVNGTYTDEATGEVKPCKDFAGFYEIGLSGATTGNGSQGNDKQSEAPSNVTGELTWEEQVFNATAFLYDHPTHQTNSINALLKNEVIKNTDTPVVSIMQILFHRAQAEYGLSADECKDILGAEVEGTVKEFMKSVNGSYKKAWEVIVGSQQKKTGTDDIPF